MEKNEITKIKCWNEVTEPFRDAAKKSGFTYIDLSRLIEKLRLRKNL